MAKNEDQKCEQVYSAPESTWRHDVIILKRFEKRKQYIPCCSSSYGHLIMLSTNNTCSLNEKTLSFSFFNRCPPKHIPCIWLIHSTMPGRRGRARQHGRLLPADAEPVNAQELCGGADRLPDAGHGTAEREVARGAGLG